MLTTTGSGRAKSAPVIEMERIIAWSFVAIAHLLFAFFATRVPVRPPVITSPMELVFIQLPRSQSPVFPSSISPSPAKTVKRIQQAVSGSSISARLKLRLEIESAKPPATDSSPARPSQLATADDQWSDTPKTAKKDDGISFERNKLTTSFNPIRANAPTRLRLRREFSPRDILRAVSKELFWPPGYTDDPCVGLAKAVEIFSAGSTSREYQLLADAALQQSRYCN